MESTFGKTIRERIREDRQALHEILITAILFGLTLNLLASSIWEFPAYTMTLEPWPFGWYLFWTVVAAVSTYLLFTSLVKQYLGDESSIVRRFESVLVWDSRSGELSRLNWPYVPQLIAHLRVSRYDNNTKSRLLENLKASTQDLEKIDESIVAQLFEDVLTYILSDKKFLHSNPPPHPANELLDIPTQIPSLDMYQFTLRWPEEIESITHSSKNDTRIIEVNLKGASGCKILFTFSVGIEKSFYNNEVVEGALIDFYSIIPFFNLPGLAEVPEPSSLLLASIQVKAEAHFDPMKLRRGGDEVDCIVEWIEETLDTMANVWDWGKQKSNFLFLRTAEQRLKHMGYQPDGLS